MIIVNVILVVYILVICVAVYRGFIIPNKRRYKKVKEDYENNEKIRIHLNNENRLLGDNIYEYSIGEIVLDKTFKNRKCKITDKTENSIEVYIEARDKDKKYEERKGVPHKEWFYIKDFNKRFNKEI